MPTLAWSTLRNEIFNELGLFEGTSDNITATTLVDAAAEDEFDVDDFFINWFLFPEAGTNAGLTRRCSDYVANGGTFTHQGVNWTADATAREYGVYRLHPVRARTHFNRARQDLFPHVAIVRDYRLLHTGPLQRVYTLPTTLRAGPYSVYLEPRLAVDPLAENLCTDPGFENWTNATALGDWTLTGTGATVNREQETTSPRNFAVLQDTYSARVVSASSGETTLLQTVTPSQATQSVELNVTVWVYCLTASRVSLRIGSTDGATHTGTGWELLSQSANLSATATDFSVGVACTAGAVISFYVDEITARLGPSEPIDFGWDPLYNWKWVPPVAGAANGGTLEFPYLLPAKRRLRIMARDLVSSVTADTDTIEVDGEQVDILYNKTREMLCLEAALGGPAGERGYWAQKGQEYRARVEDALRTGKGYWMPKPKGKIPDA